MLKKNIAKKIVISVAILFTAWILLGITILNNRSYDDRLRNIGYSTEEIISIKKHLSNSAIEVLLDYRYIENIMGFINDPNYIEKDLAGYLDFFFKHRTAKINDIIILVNNNHHNLAYSPDISNIINHEDFNIEMLNRYLAYYQLFELDANNIIVAVHNDWDKEGLEMDEVTAVFLGRKYFLQRNLDRYKNFYLQNADLNGDEIILRVNSNLDRVLYVDINKTDMSKKNLILVNKYYYLASDYVPDNLVNIDSTHGRGELQKDAYDAFIRMYDAAKKENLNLYIASSYRSFKRQNELYTMYVSNDGQTKADTYSARPGFSEHQTGLVVDLALSTDQSINNFEKYDEFKWMQNNAHKYGFILRYPLGKEYITAYMYEPWHYRYIGVDEATYMHEHGITFEEYYEYYVK